MSQAAASASEAGLRAAAADEKAAAADEKPILQAMQQRMADMLLQMQKLSSENRDLHCEVRRLRSRGGVGDKENV